MKAFFQEVGRTGKLKSPAQLTRARGACSAKQRLMQREQPRASKQKRPGMEKEEWKSLQCIARAWKKKN